MCLIFGRRSVVGPPRARGPLISGQSYVCRVCARSAFIREIPENLKTCFPPLITPHHLSRRWLLSSLCCFFSVEGRVKKDGRDVGNAEWTMMACRRCLSLLLRTSRMATNEQHTRRWREIFNNFFKNISSHTSRLCVLCVASRKDKTKLSRIYTKWRIHIWDIKQSALASAEKENEKFFFGHFVVISLLCYLVCCSWGRWETCVIATSTDQHKSTIQQWFLLLPSYTCFLTIVEEPIISLLLLPLSASLCFFSGSSHPRVYTIYSLLVPARVYRQSSLVWRW